MHQPMQNLLKKISERQAKIGIAGLGYVGLPLALRFAEQGFKVLGFDIDEGKVDKLKKGKSYIEHIPHERIEFLRTHGFETFATFERAEECDALILCVPTPLNKYREPDLTLCFEYG